MLPFILLLNFGAKISHLPSLKDETRGQRGVGAVVESLKIVVFTTVLKTGPDRPVRPVQPGTGS